MTELIGQVTEQPNEITLKSIVLRVQQWFRYLLGKWLVILIFGLVGAGLGLTTSLLQKPGYKAELTFVLEDNKTSTFGAYAGLASQFGIDLGSASNTGIFSGDNILEFLKSRLLVEKTLLSPITEQDTALSLADLYIEFNGISERWKQNKALKAFSFPPTQKRTDFTLAQDSILKILYAQIIKKDLVIAKPNKKLSFISVACTTQNEFFSKKFTERLVDEAINFYVQTRTQRSKATVIKLQAKADSITALLNKRTFAIASSQDMNLNPARNVAGVNIEVATRDKIILQTMYAEVIKNLELSKIAMAQETPIIQIVDSPILPLEKVKLGKLRGLLIGGFLGGFLIVLWLLLRKAYQEMMA